MRRIYFIAFILGSITLGCNNHKGKSHTMILKSGDTLTFFLDTVVIASPSLIYNSDSAMLFFDYTSETILSCSSVKNRLLWVNKINEYIDRIQHPMGIYTFGAFTPDRLYCFLYCSLFLIDVKAGSSIEAAHVFEAGGLAFTPDSYNYTKAYDPEKDLFFFSASPGLSPTDKNYLDLRTVFTFDLKSFSFDTIDLSPPPNYIRGKNYNILEKPCLAFGNGNLYCGYPLSPEIIAYNTQRKTTEKIPFQPANVDISYNIIPQSSEKSNSMAYYYFKANSIYLLFYDSGCLYVFYKEADPDYDKTKKHYKNMCLWIYNIEKNEVVMDQKLDFMKEGVFIADVRANKIFLHVSDSNSDLEKNFRMIIYEIIL
ncbi:MAG: hypothetical protein JXA03_12450 [Bacteroidales bacterium]|nr:hypothetical protein [Bacteroidales bacterium]